MVTLPIHYSCQSIDEEDIAAVTAVLRGDALTQGPAITVFETSVTEYCRAPYGIAVSSATSGLHLACMALGVQEGDLVWTTPMSFAASANCARYVGADVDFVDIDMQTGNLCIEDLADKLRGAKAAGRVPKLIICVHFTGLACDMDALHALKKDYGFALIEDAAHALGARYASGAPVGSHTATDATVFSFHPVKPITTGEGGMVVTHDAALAQKIRLLRSHGITRDLAQLENSTLPAWYYEQQSLGYNYRMTDFQAALGTSQMRKLEHFMQRRRELATRYRALLAGLDIALPPANDYSGWHLYVVRTRQRDRVFTALRDAQIGVGVHYIPIHLHPYYRKLGFTEGMFPKAEAYYAQCLSLPLHPRLADDDQDYVAERLKASLSAR